jgi:methionine synthase II (cobalamin-independent)
MAVQQNTDHIQTTHIGSFPRPHSLDLAGIFYLTAARSGGAAARIKQITAEDKVASEALVALRVLDQKDGSHAPTAD